jgi:hypothetical protein
MPRTTVTQKIKAPLDRVFGIIADPLQLALATPGKARVVFLSEQQTGVGTRYRATRAMNGKDVATDLEITELVPNHYVRHVNVTHGRLWDSVYTVQKARAGTLLTLTMDGVTSRLIPKLMTYLLHPVFRKYLQRDLDAVKAFCER